MGFEAAVWDGGLATSGEQRVNEGGGPDRRGRVRSGGEQRGFFPVMGRENGTQNPHSGQRETQPSSHMKCGIRPQFKRHPGT